MLSDFDDDDFDSQPTKSKNGPKIIHDDSNSSLDLLVSSGSPKKDINPSLDREKAFELEVPDKSELSPLPSPKRFSPTPSPSASRSAVNQQVQSTSPEPMTTDGNKIRSLLEELEESMDDVGEIKRQFMSKIVPDDEEFNSSQVPVDTVSKREVQDLIDNLPKPMRQRPIQPGSSPGDEDNRFLCWNNTGIIRARFGDEDQCIDVMFHDTEKHSHVNFKNEPNYTLASMSDDAIVVGSNGKYGSGPASIHGMNLLEANREQREWQVELPHVELIDALAVGSGFVAVATDQRNLRLFNHGGMQSYLFTMSDQIVCMAAYERQLMLILHDGAGQVDEQKLVMLVYHIDLHSNTFRLSYNNIPVSLSKRSPLAWAGFSDEGTPCTYDYNGTLRMYRHELGRVWVPLLDLRELTSSALDHYFVVGVSEISQAVRAVRCKRSRYPDFSTETAEVFSFNLPMCELDTDQGKLEEEHVRLRLAELSYRRLSQFDSLATLANSANESNEKLLVNTILKLFAFYLKGDKEELAKGLVYMIPREHMSKLPEFAWKTNRRQYFIDSLNKAIEEREQLEYEIKANGLCDDDAISVSSITSNHDLGKESRKELNKNREDCRLKPIPLDKLMTNTYGTDNNNRVQTVDDVSDDENDATKAKRTKSINYNLFSKKRPKIS